MRLNVSVLERVCVLSLTVSSLFQLLLMSKEIDVRELDFLLRFNIDHNYNSPLDFLSNTAWSAIKVQAHTGYFNWLTEINYTINHCLLLLSLPR